MEYNIRPIRIEDAQGINVLRRMPGVFETILGIPSERIKNSEDFIEDLGPNTHQFVAIANEWDDDEIVIGSAGLHLFTNPRLRHSAGIGIMVHKDFQDMGIGTKLMKTLIDLADNWLMLIRLELTVFSDNERAIALYERMGFVKEGLKKKSAVKNGEYCDEIMMARIK